MRSPLESSDVSKALRGWVALALVVTALHVQGCLVDDSLQCGEACAGSGPSSSSDGGTDGTPSLGEGDAAARGGTDGGPDTARNEGADAGVDAGGAIGVDAGIDTGAAVGADASCLPLNSPCDDGNSCCTGQCSSHTCVPH
jgi:hypothetical protein